MQSVMVPLVVHVGSLQHWLVATLQISPQCNQYMLARARAPKMPGIEMHSRDKYVPAAVRTWCSRRISLPAALAANLPEMLRSGFKNSYIEFPHFLHASCGSRPADGTKAHCATLGTSQSCAVLEQAIRAITPRGKRFCAAL